MYCQWPTCVCRCNHELSVIYGRSPMKMAKLKTIVDESSMFSIVSPSVAKLTDALKSAQSWTSKVASLLVGDCTVSFLFLFVITWVHTMQDKGIVNSVSTLCHALVGVMFWPWFVHVLVIRISQKVVSEFLWNLWIREELMEFWKWCKYVRVGAYFSYMHAAAARK